MPERPVHSPEPDEALRAAYGRGEPAALDALAVSFFADVTRFAQSRLRDGDEAAEAVQETFLRIFELHRTYRADRPFRPWLFGICRVCCMEVSRIREGRRARVVDLDGVDPESAFLVDSGPSAADALIRGEIDHAALVRLGGLGEDAASIVTLHLFEEMTFREIGEVLGRPGATVATTYYRALAQLRARATREGGLGG